MKKLISIIIPAYNEEEVVNELANRLKGVMNQQLEYEFEILIIENGSKDNTLIKLLSIQQTDPRFKIIQLSRNFGSDGGILAGLSLANGDAAVIMCADLQDPPELINNFIEYWEKGYEIVYGIIRKREGVAFTRKINSILAYKIINYFSGNQIPENVSEFRLIDKKVYNIVNIISEKNKYIRGLIAWTGFKQIGVEFERPSRYAGESKAGFLDALNFAINGIFSFSNLPLYLSSIIGGSVFIISIVLIAYEISQYLYYGQIVPGITTLILLLLFMFGILFLVIGIIGVYLARIYEEVKHRPDYIIKNVFNKN